MRYGTLIKGTHIGRKIAKGWLMKPKAQAGSSLTPGKPVARVTSKHAAPPPKPVKVNTADRRRAGSR